MKTKRDIYLAKSELKEMRNKLNDDWVSDEEKERIRTVLRSCKIDPKDQMFDFNPLHILYGLWVIVVLPFGFLWLGIKKLLGHKGRKP